MEARGIPLRYEDAKIGVQGFLFCIHNKNPACAIDAQGSSSNRFPQVA